RDIEPVTPRAYARFLGQWQHLVPYRENGRRDRATWRGSDGLLSVIDQLAGVSLPLSTWEQQILPARIPDYTPAMLDELLAGGEVTWSGHGRLGAADGWIRLHLADALALGLDSEQVETAAGDLDDGSLTARLLEILRSTPGALRHTDLLTSLADAGEAAGPAEVTEALWDLAFAGLITNDSFAPLRSLLRGRAPTRGTRGASRSRPTSRRGAARLSAAMLRAGASTPAELEAGPAGAGRWSALRVQAVDPAARAAAVATLLLDRHGVVTRGAMGMEDIPGSFAAVYRVLSQLEEAGQSRRGYFVDGLGASQFAPAEAVDLLRDRDAEDTARSESASPRSIALAATDPANPYGAALPWPPLPAPPAEGPAARPARRAGALVLLIDGEPAAFVERGGKSLLWWAGDERQTLAAEQLVIAIRDEGRLESLTIERI
ncbi:MAG: DEAD/DEAH box helicase, partial [Brachybacterium sp.]|nr:DEAD/DEAH box helicase [Brachybacterium sp.]